MHTSFIHPCLILLLSSALTLTPYVDGLFSNTIHGFVQDVQQNPASLLALFAFKYWLLLSTGAISITPTAIGKRDTTSSTKLEIDSIYADIVSQMDSDQCVPRLICDTFAQPEPKGTVYDKIAAAFGEKKPQFPANRNSPLFIYKYAAFVGQHSSSQESCKRNFRKCKQNDAQLQKTATFIFESNSW